MYSSISCVGTVDKNSWRSTTFRNGVQSKLNAAIQKYGPITTKNAVEVEKYCFERATTRDQYMSCVARIILVMRERSAVRTAAESQICSSTAEISQSIIQARKRLQEQILSQKLNAISSIQNNDVGMQGALTAIQMGEHVGPPQSNQLPADFIPKHINFSMPKQMNISLNSPTATLTITSAVKMTNGEPNSVSESTVCKREPDSSVTTFEIKENTLARSALNQLLRKHPMLSMSSQMSSVLLNVGQSNQMNVPGPMRIKLGRAGRSNSPDLTHVQLRSQAPYLLLRHNANGVARAVSIGSVSPIMPSQTTGIPIISDHEKAYQSKVKELSRYIEPIKKMISILGNGEVEKIVKLKRLLEILCSPQSPHARTTMEALHKIEAVLKKLDAKVAERQTRINEEDRMIEDISATLQKTVI